MLFYSCLGYNENSTELPSFKDKLQARIAMIIIIKQYVYPNIYCYFLFCCHIASLDGRSKSPPFQSLPCDIRQKKKYICVFQVSRPYLGFCPDPKDFFVNCVQNVVKFTKKCRKMYWKMQFLYKIFQQNKMLCRPTIPSFFIAETWNTHIFFCLILGSYKGINYPQCYLKIFMHVQHMLPPIIKTSVENVIVSI